MSNEIEPAYFKKFRKHIDKKIQTTIEKEIDKLALVTDKNFARVGKDIAMIRETMVAKDDLQREINAVRSEMATEKELAVVIHRMATKDDLKPIFELIGKYEIRAQNVENILLHEHKPRLAELEKVVFA